MLRPSRLRGDATEELIALELDALVLFAYGRLLPQRLLDGPRFGGINVHPSLLPRWRGASPINAAILAGDRETGVCIMQMEAGLDTGPVYARDVMAVPDRATAPDLFVALGERGARLTIDVLAKVGAGTAVALPQDGTGVTYAPLLRREDGRVDWTLRDAVEVDRHVRAMQPWPGTTVSLGGQDVTVVRGEPVASIDVGAVPGTVLALEGDGVVVAARVGAYRILDVRPPGRRTMDAASYWRGRRVRHTP